MNENEIIFSLRGLWYLVMDTNEVFLVNFTDQTVSLEEWQLLEPWQQDRFEFELDYIYDFSQNLTMKKKIRNSKISGYIPMSKIRQFTNRK